MAHVDTTHVSKLEISHQLQREYLQGDIIHDMQYDYYSRRLATCSSDRTVKIFDISGEIYHNCATLQGHEGPVW